MQGIIDSSTVFALVLLGAMGTTKALHVWAKAYRRKRDARLEAERLRQMEEDDAYIAYMQAWVENEIYIRNQRMAEARKKSSPSLQDYDLAKCKQEQLALPMP